MIQRIEIENFKSLKNVDFNLSNLNLLTGLNGMGKSSFIQILLLIRQSYFQKLLGEGLSLNGSLTEIGTAADAFYKLAEKEEIGFKIFFDDDIIGDWTFRYQNREETFLFLAEKTSETKKSDNKNLFNQSLFTEKFKYLSTARIVPRLYYTSSHYEEKIANPLGNDGRNVIEYLVLKGTKELLLKNLSHKDGFSEKGESLPLIDQVEAWMGEICPGTKIEARKDDITKLSNIMYSFKRGNTTIGEFSPINVGFGITHVLPVIVALLSAESGEMIIIIENPETNLHPRGQAKLAELIALTAQNGVQIFIETHSDHIINGTLVAIKKFRTEQKGISHDKVRIFYFERDESTHASQAIPVPVLEGGYIKEVPQGFFDQIEKDMEIMMGF